MLVLFTAVKREEVILSTFVQYLSIISTVCTVYKKTCWN